MDLQDLQQFSVVPITATVQWTDPDGRVFTGKVCTGDGLFIAWQKAITNGCVVFEGIRPPFNAEVRVLDNGE